METVYGYCSRIKCESCSVMSDSLPPHGVYCPWNSPGQNTGVGSLSLLQGIFPTQGSNPGLLHCTPLLYHLNHRVALCDQGLILKKKALLKPIWEFGLLSISCARLLLWHLTITLYFSLPHSHTHTHTHTRLIFCPCNLLRFLSQLRYNPVYPEYCACY